MKTDFDPIDIENNKLMAMLCYLGVLILVPVLAAKNSKYVRFHMNQGLVVFIGSILYGFVTGVLGSLLTSMSSLFSLLLLPFMLASFVFPILMIVGICNALMGKATPIPILGNIHLID